MIPDVDGTTTSFAVFLEVFSGQLTGPQQSIRAVLQLLELPRR